MTVSRRFTALRGAFSGLVALEQPLGLRSAMLATVAASAFLTPSAAQATPEILSGNYIKIGVNDIGTLGYGGNTSPGILYDGTGTSTFNPSYDYLTPGSPWESFVVAANSTTYSNNNARLYSPAISGTLTSYNGVAYNGTTYDQRAVWTGTVAGKFTITNDYYFNVTDQQLRIATTISALSDLTGVTFLRELDPDAVAASGDSSVTNNFRGNGSVSANDLVYAEALVSKYVIGLYTDSTITHNTGVTGWTNNPSDYLSGTDVGNGDNTIGLAYDIGAMLSGTSLSINYSYIFGTNIATAIDTNTGGGTGGGTPPAAPITTTQTTDDLAAGTTLPSFDGGTLDVTGPTTVSLPFTVNAAGGTIDTGTNNATFTGDFTGTGGLDKTGSGTLTLAGANSFSGGLAIDGGTVAASSPDNLGTGTITIGSGRLQADGDFTAANAITLASTTSTVDTNGHALALSGDISGGNVLNKVGTGTLTLSGTNSQILTGVLGGTLVATSAASLGAGSGTLYLGNDATFIAGNSMTISQNLLIGGTGSTVDTGANDVTLTGTSDGLACLTKNGSGKLTLAAASSNQIGACVQQGTLAFNNVFTGNVWVEQGGSMGGNGAVNGNVEVHGTLSPGNSPGQLFVNGSVSQFAGSTLSVDIDGTTPGNGAGHYDQLVLLGSGSVYTAAGTIVPVLRGITGDATNSYTAAIGSRYTVVTAEGGVTGRFDTLTQPTGGVAANARFDILYNPNSIVLYVTPGSYAALYGTATMRNAAAAAGAIDAFRSTAGSANADSAGALLNGLYPLASAGVNRALEQASGVIYADAMDSVVMMTRASHNAVTDHLNGSVDDTADHASLGQRIWGAINHGINRVHDDAYGQGYHASDLSVVIGADKKVRPNLVVGGAFAYGRARTTTASVGDATAHSYHGIAYARYNAPRWYANALLSVGGDHYSVRRTVDLTPTAASAAGKTDGLSVGGDVEAGYKLTFGKTVLTPAVGLSYDRLNRDDLQESGSAAVALTLDKDYRRSLVGRAGARLSTSYTAQGTTLIPYVSAFVTQELSDRSSVITPTLHNARFVVTAPEAGRTNARLAAGVTAVLSPAVALRFSYRYNNAGGYSSNAVSGGVSVRW